MRHLALTDDVGKGERDARVKFHLRQLGARQLVNVLGLASTQPEVASTGAEYDQDPWLFAVQNGVIDLRTGRFRVGRPTDYLSAVAAASYHAEAICPRWQLFLTEVFDENTALIAFVQRLIGYCLTGSTREQVVVCFHGAGANGKGTFVESICRPVLGEYAGRLPFASLLQGRDNRAVPDDLASIAHARLVEASEPRESGRLDEGRIKSFSGEDTLPARHLFGRWFQFQPQFKLLLQFNRRPHAADTSHGFWRRVLLVPFNRRFSDQDRDNELKAKLAAEAPGILNWAIDGCLAWRERGLQPPTDVRAAVAEWREEEDVVAEFLASCCDVTSDAAWEGTGTLFAAFEAWCEREHRDPRERLRRKAFTARLTDHLDADKRQNVRGFAGVTLKPGARIS